VPSNVSPEAPTDLSPVEGVPKARVVPQGGNGGTSSSAVPGKTSYQTRRPGSETRIARRQSQNLPKTTVSTPEPTSRSAQAQPRPGASDPRESDAQDPLDHLPPLDLPGEVTRSTATPPAAPAAAAPARPSDGAKKTPEVKREAPAPAANELDLTSATIPAPEPSPSASVGPGIARFVAVDLKLAGGSVPSGAGLNWLVEKGYRTVLDLRESSEVPSSFIAEVTNHGLRYVALPIGLKSIDRNHLTRFNFEIAAGEARPLFFFDSDGTRAGALWYIRRMTSDRVDRQIARREAEELGLSDPGYWSAVTNFVTAPGTAQSSADSGDVRQGPENPQVSFAGSPSARARVSTRDVPPPPTAARQHDPDEPKSLPAGISPGLAPVVPDAPAQQATTPRAPSVIPDQFPAEPTTPGDPLLWRPFAAMVITGLSLPLAYWSRTLAPTVLARAWASLPAPAHRPKSIRGELGA